MFISQKKKRSLFVVRMLLLCVRWQAFERQHESVNKRNSNGSNKFVRWSHGKRLKFVVLKYAHAHTMSRAHSAQIHRHTIFRVCVRGRDESFRMVYRFGKHVRCACCKILLIYDYLLHILVYAAAVAMAVMATKLRNVVAGKPNDAIRFRMEKEAISVTENLNATTQMQNEYIDAWLLAAVLVAPAHRYLCQLLCRISGCTIHGSSSTTTNTFTQNGMCGISRIISARRGWATEHLSCISVV